MRIGITLGLQNKNESIWINGIKMNAIFLAKALKATGNKVTIYDTSQKIPEKELSTSVVWDSKEFPVKSYWSHTKEIDVLILLGTVLPVESLKAFKKLKKSNKVIKYQCGNNYVIDMERVIFSKDPEKQIGAGYKSAEFVDEIWYVPQQGFQNHHYYRVLCNKADDKVKPVPFIWDPMFLDEACKNYGQNHIQENKFPVYTGMKEEPQICVFEPNMNVVKYALLPMLIVEDYMKQDGKIHKLNLMSSKKLFKNFYFSTILSGSKLLSEGGKYLKAYGRYNVIDTLAQHADIVVSHQWQNPLNYAYLDTLYLQYPLIHNAEMIQDAGYYYPDFDLKKGTEALFDAVKNHDKNLEAYNENTEEVLTRYTVYNEGLIETYKKLLQNLWKGENIHKLSYEYNWKTNLYK